jgi:hypothetical protein
MANLTGYKFHKVVNEELALHGLDPIPPQMIYNYISKKYIPSIEIDGKRFVTEEAGAEWQAKYVAKRLNKVPSVNLVPSTVDVGANEFQDELDEVTEEVAE